MLIYGGVMFAYRMRNWERGRPDNRATTAKNVKRRMADFRAGVYMQTLLRDPAAGIMHSLIYFSFLILLGVTTLSEIDHQLPPGLKFLDGTTYQAYAFVGDLGRRHLPGRRRVGDRAPLRPAALPHPHQVQARARGHPRHRSSSSASPASSPRRSASPSIGRPEFEMWSFIGYPLAALFENVDNLDGWHQAWWIVHVAHLHRLPGHPAGHDAAPHVHVAAQHVPADRDRPKGAMQPMPNLMETELESFGASTIEDFTWKQLLDTDACTMCGRCTSVCPAHATGKPLDPREIVLKTGEVMAATGAPQVSPPIGVDADITVGADSVFERITSEEVWACTTCKACDEICPVNIEILDKILDMRRYLSLMESDFPTELGNAYRAMENYGNPWGISQNERADWADKLDGIDIVDGTSPLDHEYLYWVGCAGSFDDKNKKVTQAMAQLLQRAGIDFAILGPSENCTGDPARRSGNEYIFQMLAMQNIETMNGMGVKKIITQCPHCFNTLKNEYPQLGGNYEVVHHSQFLE